METDKLEELAREEAEKILQKAMNAALEIEKEIERVENIQKLEKIEKLEKIHEEVEEVEKVEDL